MTLQRNIRLLTWFNFFTDFRLYAPIAIIYFSRVAHSYALGASVFSITYIVSAIFDVPTGIFADHVGRKRTMVLGALFAVFYALSYAIARNYAVLVVAAVCEGISRALYSGNNNALLHNLLSDEGVEHEYHVYSGKLSSMFQIALGISGLLGAILATWSFPLIMWLSVIPALLCLGISFGVSDSKRIAEKKANYLAEIKAGVAAFAKNAKLRLLSVASVVDFGLGETSYQFQAAFYATVMPVWAIGIAKALSSLGAAIGFYWSGKVINRFGHAKTLFFGELYSKVLSFTALIFPSAVTVFAATSNSLFYGTGSTAEDSLMQEEFTDTQRATMSSLNSFGGSLFFGVFAFVTGLFADRIGPRYALLIEQVCSLFVLYLLWRLLKLPRKLATK